MTIGTKKLVISEELKRKVEMICKLAYVEYSFTNGYIINLKTMKEAEDYFKRLEKYVGDYKLNYYISEIDEKEKRFNYTQNNNYKIKLDMLMSSFSIYIL